jgi:hypothetical protein
MLSLTQSCHDATESASEARAICLLAVRWPQLGAVPDFLSRTHVPQLGAYGARRSHGSALNAQRYAREVSLTANCKRTCPRATANWLAACSRTLHPSRRLGGALPMTRPQPAELLYGQHTPSRRAACHKVQWQHIPRHVGGHAARGCACLALTGYHRFRHPTPRWRACGG